MKPLNYNQGSPATPHNNITIIRLHLCWTSCYWIYFKIWTYHNIAMIQLHLYSTASPVYHWISLQNSAISGLGQSVVTKLVNIGVWLLLSLPADEWAQLDRLAWWWWRIWRLQTTPRHPCTCWLANEEAVSDPVRACCLGKFLTRDWLEFLLTISASARLVSLVSALPPPQTSNFLIFSGKLFFT